MFASSGARKAAFVSHSNKITELMDLHWAKLVRVTVRLPAKVVQKQSADLVTGFHRLAAGRMAELEPERDYQVQATSRDSITASNVGKVMTFFMARSILRKR